MIQNQPVARGPRIAPIALLVLLCFTFPTNAQQLKGEVREFTINPVAPPEPALKYRLLFAPLDRTPGNAATAYMQAAMLITPEADQLQDKSMDARGAGNEGAFYEAAMQLIPLTDGMVDV